MKNPVLVSFCTLFLSFAPLGAVLAAGTSDGSSETTPEKSKYELAVEAIDAEKWADAEELLKRVVQVDPKNADAWNYLGFSQRMQGNLEGSLVSYQKALALNPDHIGANEYLGELYLQMKDPVGAEGQLAKLQSICGDCEEATELAEKIADYKAANPS